MRPFVLASFLLAAAAPADAQARSEWDRPPSDQRVLLSVMGVAGGASAAALTAWVLYPASNTRVGAAVTALAYPLGVAASVVLVSRAEGLDASFDDVLVDAAVGVPVGAVAGLVAGGAVGGAVFLVTGPQDYNVLPVLVGLGVGTVVAVATSGAYATRGVRVAPAVLATPTGQRTPGVTLQIGL